LPARSFDVLGVGANSVDYVYSLPEFPRPDSPAAKLRIREHAELCGGQTATTLCTCAAMGLRTKYVGATGNDENGARVRRELERRGVDVEHVHVRNVPNPFAVILLDERQGERVVLWERDPALQLKSGDVDPSVIARSRLIHVDDADEPAAIQAATLGRAAGIPVTSDIERMTGLTGELVAAVTIQIFAEHVLGPLTGERDMERALRAVRKVRRKPDTTYEGDLICVTLGARGAMLLAGDRLYQVEGHRVDVVDTTGAGDVFRGAFIVALLRGDGPEEILRFANAAAAVSCTRRGAIEGVPTIAEVEALLR
jgi:sugar/nucleoside kinase (ribokinase family)